MHHEVCPRREESKNMFKEEREESQFEWSMLGDIEEGRPNLGPMVHVAVYRLIPGCAHRSKKSRFL